MAVSGIGSIWSWFTKPFFGNPTKPQIVSLVEKVKREMVEEWDETSPHQLTNTLTHTITSAYQAKKGSQSDQTKKFLQTILTYLEQKDELWADGVTRCVAETLVKELYGKEKNDSRLLDALIQCHLPLNPANQRSASSWKDWTAFYINVLATKNHLEELPDYIKKIVIDYGAKAETLKLAEHTAAFSIDQLKTHLSEEICEAYLKDVLTAVLNNQSNLNLDKKLILSSIHTAISELDLQNVGVDHVEKMVEVIAPLISERVTTFITELFTNQYSFTDEATQIFEAHLNGLQDAKIKADSARAINFALFDKKSLDAFFAKTSFKDDDEKWMAQIIYGEKFATLTPNERQVEQKKFLNRYKYNYLEYVNFRELETTHPALKEKTVFSREVAEQVFKLADTLLDENFVISLVGQLKERGEFNIKFGNKEQVKSILPLFKVFLRAYLVQLFEKGFYDKYIEPELEETSLNKRLIESVLPSIKSTLYLDLVQKVIHNNIYALEKGLQSVIKIEVLKVLGKDPKSEDIDLENVISAVFLRYGEFKKRINSKEDDKQLFGQFIEYTPKNGQGNQNSYAQVAKILLFEYGGLPFWLKYVIKSIIFLVSWFHNVDKYISLSITSLFYNYRKTPRYVAKIIETRALLQYPLSSKRVTSVPPFQPTKIEEISKILYVTSAYEASYIYKFVLWCTLGSEGKKITEIYNRVLSETLYKGSHFNKSLFMNLLVALNDRMVVVGGPK